jgi:hypothetical protein
MRQKSITLRLPEEEYMAFTVVCNEKGYSKTGKIREYIREMVKKEIGEVELKASEWKKVRAGIKEIEKRDIPLGRSSVTSPAGSWRISKIANNARRSLDP